MEVNITANMYPEQKAVIKDTFSGKYQFITVKSGRQAGKSYTLDRAAIASALKNPDSEVLWVTPSHSQSLDAHERVTDMLIGKIPFKSASSSTDRRVTFKNGSKIRYFSAEKFDNLRGKHPTFLVILDEFAFFRPEAWNYGIKPYFIANKDLVALTASTPNGKNDFQDLYFEGLNADFTTRVSHDLHYSMNPQVNIEFIEEEKKKLPKMIYDQEYEGLFVEGGGLVFGDFTTNISNWEDYIFGKAYYFGIDWSGTGKDKTVITIIDSFGKVCLIYEVKASITPEQCRELVPIINSYKATGIGEKNGLGEAGCDLLREAGIGLTKFTMTNSEKQSLVAETIEDLNKKDLKLPTDKLCVKLQIEMHDYIAKRTSTGLISYSHPTGGHDDYVDSLMLANRARKDSDYDIEIY